MSCSSSRPGTAVAAPSGGQVARPSPGRWSAGPAPDQNAADPITLVVVVVVVVAWAS
jgi:hypothetical protein